MSSPRFCTGRAGTADANTKLEGTAGTQVQDWRSITDYWPSPKGRSVIDSVMKVPGSETSTSAYCWVFSDNEYAIIELQGTKGINLQYWRPKGTDWSTLRA